VHIAAYIRADAPPFFDLYRSIRFWHVVAGIEAFAGWARSA
jgi:hypothetical protein